MHLSKEAFCALKMRVQHHQVLSITIASSSMSPLIKKGEHLQVKKKKILRTL